MNLKKLKYLIDKKSPLDHNYIYVIILIINYLFSRKSPYFFNNNFYNSVKI